MAIPTFQDTFNRYVEWSIENREIHRELAKYCSKLGHDYNEVTDHISAEVRANKVHAEFDRIHEKLLDEPWHASTATPWRSVTGWVRGCWVGITEQQDGLICYSINDTFGSSLTTDDRGRALETCIAWN